MLWRALKHVDHGFYIDVGANAPSEDSVTRAFYDKGWKGINIEPVAEHHAELQAARPRDINLCCAAGADAGKAQIWQCEVRGWASIDEKNIKAHEANGISGSFSEVPMETLRHICEQYAPDEIHFLKIDVEGFEQEVLEGMDFQNHRPWIVLVEATRPNTTEENHRDWESLLISSSYAFVYADGINRFYLAREHQALTPAFRYPPNFLDAFHVAKYEAIHRIAQAAQADAYAASSQLQATEARARHAENAHQHAEAHAQEAEVGHRQAVAHAVQTELALHRMEQRALRAEVALREAEALAEEQRHLHSLQKSLFWRTASSLRVLGLGRSAAKPRKSLLVKIKRETERLSQKIERFVNKHRKLRDIISSIKKNVLSFKRSASKTNMPDSALHSLTLRELRIYHQLTSNRKSPGRGDA